MALSSDDCLVLLNTLQISLAQAGYLDAANEIATIRSRRPPADDFYGQPRELDDQERLLAPKAVIEHTVDATPQEQLSTAVRVTELMVLDPLMIAAQLPDRWQKAFPAATTMRIGQDDTAIDIGPDTSGPATVALERWQGALEAIREALAA